MVALYCSFWLLLTTGITLHGYDCVHRSLILFLSNATGARYCRWGRLRRTSPVKRCEQRHQSQGSRRKLVFLGHQGIQHFEVYFIYAVKVLLRYYYLHPVSFWNPSTTPNIVRKAIKLSTECVAFQPTAVFALNSLFYPNSHMYSILGEV